MGGRKRPLLFERGSAARSGERDAVWIPGTYQVGTRPAEDVSVTDISADGCRVQVVALGATKSAPVALRLGGEPAITGRLKWIKQASIGVAFDTPLDGATLERLGRLQPDNVVPLKRSPLR